ncbi:MAG: YkvA family protein [Cyanobacteria bacterium J06641_5]
MNLPSIFRWYRELIRNPKYRIWVILGTLAYLVSPIDISPDVFPIVGQIDDVALLGLLFTELIFWFRERQGSETEIPDLDPAQAAAVERDKQEAIDVEVTSADDLRT